MANAQRAQRAEGGSRPRQTQRAPQHAAPAAQQQTRQQPIPQTVQQFYKPYAAVPGHIKQLIEQNYQPQAPYVDPTSFLYSSSFAAPQQYEQQPTQAASELPRAAYLQPSARYQSSEPQSSLEYSDRRVERQDQVVYKDNYEQQTVPEPPLPTIYLDKNMPSELRQLLQYQAQIPYDVTANRIRYTPKSLFIPKPLSDDVKGPYYYRSKVYYMDDENAESEHPQEKPVDEQQRHR